MSNPILSHVATPTLTASAGFDVDSNTVWCEYEYQLGEKYLHLTVSKSLEDYTDYLSTKGIAEKFDGGYIVYLDDEGDATRCDPYDWFSTCNGDENTAYAKSLPEWSAFKALTKTA